MRVKSNPANGLLIGHLTRTQVQRIVAAITTVLAFDIAIGLTYPLLSFLLKEQNVGETIIGLNAAMTPIGIIMISLFIPPLVVLMGSKNLVRFSAVLMAGTLIGFKIFPSLEAWFVLRFLIGVASGIMFSLSEAWVVQAAEGPSRARIIALYAATIAAGFAIGPLLLPFTGYDSWAPFVVASVAGLLTVIPIFFITAEDQTQDEDSAMSMLAFIPLAPMLLMAVWVFAFMDAGLLSLFPAFGIENGLSKDVTSYALGVLIVGNAFLQFFIAWLADRLSKYFVIAAASLTTVLTLIILPMVIGSPLMWPVLVVMGTAGFSIYTVSLAIFGERFKGSAMIAGTSAFAAVWGIGSIIAPPVIGLSMENYGPNAMPAILAMVYGLFAVFVMFRISQGRR